MVQDRLGHFRSVLGIPDLRASGPRKARKKSKSVLAGKVGMAGWRSLSGAGEEEEDTDAVSLPMLTTAWRATTGGSSTTFHRQPSQLTFATDARGSMGVGARSGAQTALGLVSHTGAFEKSQRLLARLGSQE